jgi:hypothetical protein
MDVLFEYSLLLFVGLVLPVFGDNVCVAGVCGPKCCSTGEYFNSTTYQCQAKVTVPGKSESDEEKFSICPWGEWHFDSKENSNSSLEYQCAELVTDGSQLIGKLLFCPKEAKIPVTMCCESQINIWGNCLEKTIDPPSVSWSPVHSSTNYLTINVSTQDFQVTTDLIQCPNGSISLTSTEFTLFDDGTVKIPNITFNFSPGEVCIANSFNSTDFVARFCVPDPCTASICVRKCCPKGFLMKIKNLPNWSCERTDREFSVYYLNETGQKVLLPNTMPIRYDTISAWGGKSYPQLTEESKFNVLHNGTVYVPAYPIGHQVFDHYCVDDFEIDDKIVSSFPTIPIM